MSKSIIARAIANVNANADRLASRVAEAKNMPMFQLRVLNAQLNEAAHIQQAMHNLLNSQFHTHDVVLLELDGGDALITSKLVLSAMRTAYTAAYHAWARESGLYGDSRDIPAAHVPQKILDELMGFEDESSFEHLSFEDALRYAEAVYRYAVHIAMYKDNAFKWLLSMDVEEAGDRVTKHFVVPLPDWAIQQATESGSAKRAEHLRQFSKTLVDEELFDAMPLEFAVEGFRVWWNEPVEDGTYHSRGERIVTRVADRWSEDLIAAAAAGNHREFVKAAALHELLLASPWLKQQVQLYKGSREYRLEVLSRKVEELRVKQAEEAETKRLDALEAKLEALLGIKEPEPEVAQEPEPEVKVTVLQPVDMNRLAMRYNVSRLN